MREKTLLQHLVACLTALPGIGEKSATRLALHIVNCPKENALELARSIVEAREKINLCRQCFNYTDRDLCGICANPERDIGVLCVVETPADLLSLERAGGFKGRYHVLQGVIAPLDGIGPDQLKIAELLRRVQHSRVVEVILATNPTLNGNATAAYLADQLKLLGVRATRIAQGIPPGSDIGYADQVTLKNALDGRREIR